MLKIKNEENNPKNKQPTKQIKTQINVDLYSEKPSNENQLLMNQMGLTLKKIF